MNHRTFTPAPPLKTAVLLLVFNRPDTTKQIFEAIKVVQPPRLYVAADGARIDRSGEAENVQSVRENIIAGIDWDCEVLTLFREENLGCKVSVSSAIDWFFENEEMGIILEDDCVPNQSFFWYCEELLDKYKDDTRIWHISGDNFQNGNIRGDGSYFFSNYIHIWGWATWRRAWNHYDVKMRTFPEFKNQQKIFSVSNNKKIQKVWLDILEIVYSGEIDTWDYQWVYTCFSNGALSIMPNQNLISNIGFGEEGTHTSDKANQLANLKLSELTFPLVEPTFILINKDADNYSAKKYTLKQSLFVRVRNKILRLIDNS